MIDFLKKKLGLYTVDIKSKDEFENFKLSDNIVAVAAFPEGHKYSKVYRYASASIEYLNFGVIHDINVADEIGIKFPSLYLFTNEPEIIHYEKGWVKEDVIEFLEKESVQTVMECNDNLAKRVLDLDYFLKQYIMLFVKKDEYGKYKEMFREVAMEYKFKKLGFVHVDENNKDLIEFIGLEKRKFPFLFALRTRKRYNKYISSSQEITKDSIREFVYDFLKGKADHFLKSEDIPKVQNGTVYKLVGDTFYDIINDNTKDVLIYLYSPYEEFSRRFMSVYKEVALRLADNEHVLVAAMDMTKNDGDRIGQIDRVPTIKFVNTKNYVFEYEGNMNAKEIIEFMRINSIERYKIKEDINLEDIKPKVNPKSENNNKNDKESNKTVEYEEYEDEL